jgi:hypothetical protein
MHGMEQQLILDVIELSRIGVECSRCHAQMVVDADQDDASVPDRCPCCRNEDFAGQGVQRAIKAYVEAHRSIKQQISKTGHRFTLRVKPQTSQPVAQP